MSDKKFNGLLLAAVIIGALVATFVVAFLNAWVTYALGVQDVRPVTATILGFGIGVAGYWTYELNRR